MEDKKRKAKGILLNWDELLPEKDETPPEVEIAPPEVEIVPDESLKTVSDCELESRISRMKGMIGMKNLPDNGVKLQNKLKSLEAELDRRSKLPKTVTPLPAKSSYARSTDGFSARVPNVQSQSAFACKFGRTLDDNKANDRGSAFEEDMHNLRPCKQKETWNPPVSSKSNQKTNSSESDGSYVTLRRSNKYKRVNPPDSSKSSQKAGGVSLSKTAFSKPRHTSKNTDGNRLSNGRQSRTQFSDPLPARTRDRSPVSLKSCAPHFQASRSSGRNHKTYFHLDEEDSESEATVPVEKLDESMKDTVISYPSRDAPDAVEINYSDVECLDPKKYLSSTIMNFYIMYLQKPASLTTTKQQDYLFLNTYFYKKLTQDVLKKSDRESSFLKLRRWWKGVNIFEKAYVFLPVHESLHWSLIIICIPDKEDESGPIVLHLDSLGMHNSKSICRDVKRLLVEEWKILRQEDAVPELPIAEKVWDNLPENIDERVIEVPQQGNEFDCGIFVLFFMERFINEAPKRLKKKDLVKFGRQWFKPGEASSLRQRIRKLLIEEFKNASKVSIDLDP